jgi:hypothetical protein
MFANGTKVVRKSILKALTGDATARRQRSDATGASKFLVVIFMGLLG